MLRSLACLLGLLLLAAPAGAEPPPFEDELLARLEGPWVMRGTIAGEEVVHDIDGTWVLQGGYLRLHELARERDEQGLPAYEAIIYLGSGAPRARYACLWLDITGIEGLASEVIGYADRDGDNIPFVFGTGEDSAIHNDFAYDREADRWHWTITNMRGGERRPFGDLVLSRE